ncbi:MAG: Protein GrpE [Candidatus Uhrbacteria bacterium GW2011_GWE2_45_35]|uniref:Protein GrpE n=2 Tax=Candidatus Uhriibacteriota TaxID=1752732 RepID=A0A0G1MIT6_9BACT|nr:MAG: Protein GrpE [Candidatus Uhrbacteria bacterium GW2011_GWF2_44_350]KKU08776.1 MAG: Protein GrpE [Candidatus Uhrbacteria bacterium GW2011_GWE2_45_35]HBR80320.1 nucleotide exchange factor GrpE [Candidatus Uhrbacteria bacterium]HCU31842.1 nucleotide exchange factor GrpE [Candidatus Uhrbacteria bacterium]
MSDEKQKKEDENQNQASQALEIQAAEYLTGWKRALADYDNLKKDLARERGEMRRAVAVEMLLNLLPLLNNFDQAAKHRPHTQDQAVEAWISGALQIRSQLEEALKEIGAEPFGSEGEKFDPALHESVSIRRDENREDQIVLEVVQRGWKIGERVVLPAKVIINGI